METPSEERSLEEILATMAQLEYRNHKAIEELSGRVSETNQLLARINRRLWAQNIVAWIQLIGLILVILLIRFQDGVPVHRWCYRGISAPVKPD